MDRLEAMLFRLRGRLRRSGLARARHAPRARRGAILVSHDFSRSGAPRMVVEMAGAFLRMGLKVTCVSGADGPIRKDLQALGADVLLADAATAPGAAALAGLGAGAEIAICNTVVTAPAVAALAPRVPCYWYMHEVSLLEERLADPAVRAALAAARGAWAGSELSAALLRPHRADAEVVPYGIASVDAPAIAEDSSPVRIALFGSIERRKGQDLLLDALDRMPTERRARIALAFYGRLLEPEFGNEVLGRIRAGPGLSYGGELDRPAYLAAIAASDGVIVPSRDDTLPLVSLDALSAGRVLLMTATVGTAAYVTDGIDSYVAEAPTVAAIAAMLDRAVAERGRWPDIAAAGQRLFGRSFSTSAFAERLSQALADARAACNEAA